MLKAEQRYGDTAVIFHWLIAIFIVGLLAVGKFMVSLPENDPLRFELTQWHKSFGLTVLALSVLRLAWRFTHRPPPEPASIPTWQKWIAGLVHLCLYALLFALPITGWMMVSVSPLNIDTLWFNVFTVPHLPILNGITDRAQAAEQYEHWHELASTVLIVLMLAHIGAALKHHFIDKDTVLHRILPAWNASSFREKIVALVMLVSLPVGAAYLYADTHARGTLLAAGDSEVSFIADVTGADTPGLFEQTTVNAVLDPQSPENSSIIAVVSTGSVVSDNTQVEGSLPDAEWFNATDYPEATFESTRITAGETENTLLVEGNLTIKTTTEPVSFIMTLGEENGNAIARGEFDIDRRQFDIGMDSQANDDYVGFTVTIRFRFDIGQDAPAS